MSRLVFPLRGVRRLTASTPTFPADATEPGSAHGSDFLVDYAVTPSPGEDVTIAAPSVVEIRILPSRDPPLLTVHPVDPARWIHAVPGWLAPRPTLFAFSFPGLEDRAVQERILVDPVEEALEVGHPDVDWLEIQRMARRDVDNRLAYWAEQGEGLGGYPVRTAGLIHRFREAPGSIRVGAASLHLFEQEVDGERRKGWTWNWFDVHDLFLRLDDADAFDPSSPEMRPGSPRDEPFRIWRDPGRTGSAPALRRLTGGVQTVDYLLPTGGGIPFVPPEMQVLTRGGEIAAEALSAPDEWTHQVCYDYEPDDTTIFETPLPPPPGEPATLAPDEEDPARLPLRFGDLRVDWDRAPPGRPVDVWLRADGAGPSFPVTRDPIWTLGQAVQRAEDALEELEKWLDWKQHGPRNVELVELGLTVDAVIRNLAPGDSDIVEDREDLYPHLDRTLSGFGYRTDVLRRRTEEVANALTRWVFQALAQRPGPDRAKVVARAMDALSGTPEGRTLLANKVDEFLEPGGGGSIADASLLASLWNGHRSLHPSLSSILSRVLRIELERITAPTNGSDTSLARFRNRVRAVLSGEGGAPGFDGLDVEAVTLQHGTRSVPSLTFLYQVGQGVLRVEADVSRRIPFERALLIGREVADVFGQLTLVSDAVLLALDGHSLLTDVSDLSELPSRAADFAGSLKNMADTANKIHGSRILRGISGAVRGLSPVLRTISVGNDLEAIGEYDTAGDEASVNLQSASLVAGCVGAVAFTAGAGAAAVAVIGVVAVVLSEVASLVSSSDLELDLKRSFFGPEYGLSDPDHPDADPARPWHGKISEQIAHFRGRLYPLNATYDAGEPAVGEAPYQHLVFQPTLWEPGSLVTVDVWVDGVGLVSDQFFIPPWDDDGEGPNGEVIPPGAFTGWFYSETGEFEVRRDDDGTLEVELRMYRDAVTGLEWTVLSDSDAHATLTVTTTGRPFLEAVRTSLEGGSIEDLGRAIRSAMSQGYAHAARTVIERS
ncbi:MAG: hypothetical protein ACOC8K_01210 [Gemmatimonadota bacterium]